VSRLVLHLERQVNAARRLLGVVLEQNTSIRRQDVAAVLGSLPEVQAELLERQQLELEREQLLAEAATTLGAAPDELDLDRLIALESGSVAPRARELSFELRGLMTELGRVHEQNRVLVRQELTFLDHLMRLLSGAPEGGYSPAGFAPVPAPANVVDARA